MDFGETKKTELTMAQALIKYMQNQFIKNHDETAPFISGIWGIFGHGNVAGLGQALEENPEFPYYQARNEQGMVHAATAYARQNKNRKIFACTSSIGPGATNMITGAATATINRIPVLLLPGDTFASRTPGPVLQQLEQFSQPEVSVNDCFRPVSVYWDRIVRPEQLLHSLPMAMKALLNPGKTGAVTLALPQDVQAESFNYPLSFFEPTIHEIEKKIPHPKKLHHLVELIRASSRPLIIAGGGTGYSDAEAELSEFCSLTGIPVGETQAGKGSLSFDHKSSLGAIGVTGTLAANAIAKEADLLICLGTRLTDFTTASGTQFEHPDLKIVSINVNEFDGIKFHGYSIEADVQLSLKSLIESFKSHPWKISLDYEHHILNLKNKWDFIRNQIFDSEPEEPSTLTQAQALFEINKTLTHNDTVVCAAGSLPGDMHKLLNLNHSQQYHMEYGYSCMGYEVAGGLGVRMAKKQGEVFILVGDGSWLMMHSELLTAIQEHLKIIIILFDNHGFRCIDRLSRSCGSHGFGNDFRYRNHANGQLDAGLLSIDFVKSAESLGASAVRVQDSVSLQRAIKEAKQSEGCTVIVSDICRAHSVDSYESRWNVPVASTSQSSSVQASRAEWEKHFLA